MPKQYTGGEIFFRKITFLVVLLTGVFFSLFNNENTATAAKKTEPPQRPPLRLVRECQTLLQFPLNIEDLTPERIKTMSTDEGLRAIDELQRGLMSTRDVQLQLKTIDALGHFAQSLMGDVNFDEENFEARGWFSEKAATILLSLGKTLALAEPVRDRADVLAAQYVIEVPRESLDQVRHILTNPRIPAELRQRVLDEAKRQTLVNDFLGTLSQKKGFEERQGAAEKERLEENFEKLRNGLYPVGTNVERQSTVATVVGNRRWSLVSDSSWVQNQMTSLEQLALNSSSAPQLQMTIIDIIKQIREKRAHCPEDQKHIDAILHGFSKSPQIHWLAKKLL